MDKDPSQIPGDTGQRAGEPELTAIDIGRRGFVLGSGKALYAVPVLTLLGPATASAQGSGCDPEEPGCEPPALIDAPEAPAPPTE